MQATRIAGILSNPGFPKPTAEAAAAGGTLSVLVLTRIIPAPSRFPGATPAGGLGWQERHPAGTRQHTPSHGRPAPVRQSGRSEPLNRMA